MLFFSSAFADAFSDFSMPIATFRAPLFFAAACRLFLLPLPCCQHFRYAAAARHAIAAAMPRAAATPPIFDDYAAAQPMHYYHAADTVFACRCSFAARHAYYVKMPYALLTRIYK